PPVSSPLQTYSRRDFKVSEWLRCIEPAHRNARVPPALIEETVSEHLAVWRDRPQFNRGILDQNLFATGYWYLAHLPLPMHIRRVIDPLAVGRALRLEHAQDRMRQLHRVVAVGVHAPNLVAARARR